MLCGSIDYTSFLYKSYKMYCNDKNIYLMHPHTYTHSASGWWCYESVYTHTVLFDGIHTKEENWTAEERKKHTTYNSIRERRKTGIRDVKQNIKMKYTENVYIGFQIVNEEIRRWKEKPSESIIF